MRCIIKSFLKKIRNSGPNIRLWAAYICALTYGGILSVDFGKTGHLSELFEVTWSILQRMTYFPCASVIAYEVLSTRCNSLYNLLYIKISESWNYWQLRVLIDVNHYGV